MFYQEKKVAKFIHYGAKTEHIYIDFIYIF